MRDEEVCSGPVTRAARKAERKAEQELWQTLESLNLKEAAREVAKKDKQKKTISMKANLCKKITEFFQRSGVGE